MSLSLALLLYVTLGLAWSGLRLGCGTRAGDAMFCGVFWPMDIARRWIELVVVGLLRTRWETG